MTKKKSGVVAVDTARDRTKPAKKGMQVVTLKELRKTAKQTQKELAAALGVGQDTISRLEKRSDMLLSTLQHYVESIGGKLELVATFPDRPAVIIDRGAKSKSPPAKHNIKP